MPTEDGERRGDGVPGTAVSVVMCTYNGARHLGEQLASLAAQTLAPIELIVGDDGSTDGTIAILDDFARSAPFPVRVVRNDPRLGFGDNFLTTALRAKGDAVSFCDQDDVWEPDKIALCGAALDDPEVTMVVHGARLIDERGTAIGVFDQGIAADRVVPPLSYDPWGTFWGFSITFRRGLLDATRSLPRFEDYAAPGHAIAHDRWICFWAQMFGNTRELAEPLVRYRQHGRNLFGSGRPASKWRARSAVIVEARAYAEATKAMLDLVDTLDPGIERRFPLFDRARAHDYLARACRFRASRLAAYQASPPAALARIAWMTVTGRYRGIHDGRLRTHSIARDLQMTLAGMLPTRRPARERPTSSV